MKEPKIISAKFHTGVAIGVNGTETSVTTIPVQGAVSKNRFVDEIQLIGTWGIALLNRGEEQTTVVPFTNVTHLKVVMPKEAKKAEIKPVA